jgi:hypothetical protein
MHPYSVKFGGGLTGTLLNPLVLLVAIIAVVLIFVLPRKYTLVPFIFAIFLIPEGQQLYVAGVHLFLNRIVVLAAFVQALKSRQPKQPLYAAGWNNIDTAFVTYVVICAIATLLQYLSMPAIINQIGYLWDFLLAYFALRALIRNEYDSLLVLKCFAVLMVILGAEMIYEQMHVLNLFGTLGGVAQFPEIREGKVRAQAVFQHSLTAGAFAAPTIPLFVMLWKRRTARWIAVIAFAAATTMTLATQTSTSLLTEAAGLLGMVFWPLRRKMRKVRIGLVIAIIGLALVMKAPVWFIIAHIDLTGSSSSYQRAELIDQFVNHFSSWWLIGTQNAASWGWDMWDAQNMFVSTGETGGLAAFIFFILVISRAFGRLGTARKWTASKGQEWTIWLLGAATFANVVSFFGVNYFDQVRVAWFALLAMICATTGPILRRRSLAGLKVTLKVASASEAIPVATDVHEAPQYLSRRRLTE